MYHRYRIIIVISRDVVMHVLSQLDPEGCLQRRCNKLRRRKYTNKVNLVKNILIIT